MRKFVKKAKFIEDNSTEVSFLLPEASAHNGDFEDLFMELERSRKKLGISSFGVSDTSLEEVGWTKKYLFLTFKNNCNITIFILFQF